MYIVKYQPDFSKNKDLIDKKYIPEDQYKLIIYILY